MDQLRRIKLNINYRDDYNGRPFAEIIDNFLIAITHPFYCWEEEKYGRCYRFDLFDLQKNLLVDNFKMYCYDDIKSVIIKLAVNIFNKIINNNLEDIQLDDDIFEIHGENNTDQVLKISFEKCEWTESKRKIFDMFAYAELDTNIQGIIFHNEAIYFIKGDFDNIFIYSKNNKFNMDTVYVKTFIENLEDLPNKIYTEYNKKRLESNSIICVLDDYDVSFVLKNNKQIGQVFSSLGEIDILFIDE